MGAAMKSRTRIVLLALLGVMLVSACSRVMPFREMYSDPGRSFVQMLRWHDFTGAAGHMEQGPARAFLARYGEDQDFRIVDASEASMSFSPGDRQGVASYHLEYYILPSATVKSRRFDLEWQYIPGDRLSPGSWRITGFFPELR